jgi:hypothetical protein
MIATTPTRRRSIIPAELKPEWRSKITPAAAQGSMLAWIAMGIPIIMAGSHDKAGRYVSRLLYIAARRRWREARQLAMGIMMEDQG